MRTQRAHTFQIIQHKNLTLVIRTLPLSRIMFCNGDNKNDALSTRLFRHQANSSARHSARFVSIHENLQARTTACRMTLNPLGIICAYVFAIAFIFVRIHCRYLHCSSIHDVQRIYLLLPMHSPMICIVIGFPAFACKTACEFPQLVVARKIVQMPETWILIKRK